MSQDLLKEISEIKELSYCSNNTSKQFASFYENKYESVVKSLRRNRYFYHVRNKTLINRIPQGIKILDVGCGNGDLLRGLKPSVGVGVDLSSSMVEYAKSKTITTNLKFIHGDIYNKLVIDEIGNQKFDAILLVNILTQVHDVISLLKTLHRFCHAKTRIYIYTHSRLWQPLYRLADLIGMRVKPPEENWLPPEELRQMFYHSDFQEINSSNSILFPIKIPFISDLINNYLGFLPCVDKLSMMNMYVLRPVGEKYKNERQQDPTCSVVIPCRNEAGHIYEIVSRLPYLGSGSEYIFIEGNSTDNTEDVIKKAIDENPSLPLKFFKQEGKGKGDAVRLGFSKAKGDIFAILDADITVAPEDLPSFFQVLKDNKAEFVNGSRMVYPMEKKAMKFLNMIANKFFAIAFTYILGQPIRDTLCGTKVLWKSDYELIVNNREYFGDFDPFGDFDLLFGASKLNLKIIDLPVRYSERTYGDTNISRFRHGALLFKMMFFAYKKIKMI